MKLIYGSLLGFALASSAMAQHGASGGHAGAVHSSGAATSGRSFATASPGGGSRSFGTAPVYRPNLSSPSSPRSADRPGYSSPIGAPPFGGTQPVPGHRSHYPGNGSRPYYYSRGVYAVPGFLNYGFGYADDSYFGNQEQAASGDANAQAAPPEYGPEYPSPEQAPDQPYQPAPSRPAYQPQTAVDAAPDQPPITLLFKDGRPEQQVQNYAVTRTTLYVLDGARRHEIPLADLDLPQTERVNRDAGVEFTIPAGSE
jgi:hypothetical protein